MAFSSILPLYFICYFTAVVLSLSPVEAKKITRLSDDKLDIALDHDVIHVALGDKDQEVWTQVKLAPEQKAHRMSKNRKHGSAKPGYKLRQKGNMETNEEAETPFDKYLSKKNSKVDV